MKYIFAAHWISECLDSFSERIERALAGGEKARAAMEILVGSEVLIWHPPAQEWSDC